MWTDCCFENGKIQLWEKIKTLEWKTFFLWGPLTLGSNIGLRSDPTLSPIPCLSLLIHIVKTAWVLRKNCLSLSFSPWVFGQMIEKEPGLLRFSVFHRVERVQLTRSGRSLWSVWRRSTLSTPSSRNTSTAKNASCWTATVSLSQGNVHNSNGKSLNEGTRSIDFKIRFIRYSSPFLKNF